MDLLFLTPRAGRAQHRSEHADLCLAVLRRHDVLLDRHVEKEPKRLERAGDTELGDLVRRKPDEVPVLEADLTRVGAVDPCDEIEERRLAGAVRADHAHDLVLAHDKVEFGDNTETAEGLIDFLQLEQL